MSIINLTRVSLKQPQSLTVLDYSGRISNGSWTGYNSTFSRDTGSPILQSSASLIEFRDPIIYGFHPDVISYRDTMIYPVVYTMTRMQTL